MIENDNSIILESEGDTPSHVVILCRGHIWSLQTIGPDGHIYPRDQLLQAFDTIRTKSSIGCVNAISSLTSLPRDRWATVG